MWDEAFSVCHREAHCAIHHRRGDPEFVANRDDRCLVIVGSNLKAAFHATRERLDERVTAFPEPDHLKHLLHARLYEVPRDPVKFGMKFKVLRSRQVFVPPYLAAFAFAVGFLVEVCLRIFLTEPWEPSSTVAPLRFVEVSTKVGSVARIA